MNLTALIPTPYRILAIVLLIGSCIGFGFVQGVSRESDRNDAQALKQKQADEQAFNRALVSGKQHAQAVIEWQAAATAYYNKWQEELNNAKDNDLATCTPGTSGPMQAGIGPLVRLSATFLGMYNAAWQPGFDAQRDPGGAAYSLVEAGSVTPRQVLDNVRINAELCSADRKKLDELIDDLTDADKNTKNEMAKTVRGLGK